MKHARKDYDRIQDPAGKIPEDEPVFLIRGQDELAGELLHFYADRAAAKGADPELVQAVRKQADRVAEWHRKHGAKQADLPEDMDKEVARLEKASADTSAPEDKPKENPLAFENIPAHDLLVENGVDSFEAAVEVHNTDGLDTINGIGDKTEQEILDFMTEAGCLDPVPAQENDNTNEEE